MRPTISLCCILKDEIKNLPQMLASVKDCFDEIHLTDTGSTDGSIEWIQTQINSYKDAGVNICNTPIFLKHFEWCDDFAKARNHSMDGVKTDYVMWMDLDDVMGDREKFIKWRDNVMLLADFWLAKYHYAFHNDKPVCTFLRERVVSTKKKFSWEFFVHEGMIAKESVNAQVINSWSILHKRTPEDYEKDFQRNVTMLEKVAKTQELPPRLKFYYGKELFDKNRFQEAYVWLHQIIDNPSLEHHDKVLTFEYFIRASMHRYQQEQIHKPDPDRTIIANALRYGLLSLALAPERAELWCLVGDCFNLLGKPIEAQPFFEGAKCLVPSANSFLFSNEAAYTFIPSNQICRIKMAKGDVDGALFEAKTAFEKFKHPETEMILKEILKVKDFNEKSRGPKVKTNEIVISAIPGSHPYSFDDKVYHEKGIGGSETALVEVAKHLRVLTKKPVIVFNGRENIFVSSEGVEYRNSHHMAEYFSKFEPETHIAWRHNIKLTDAPTYLWCHDLVTPGAQISSIYEKIICLSDFHKNYVQDQQGIPDEKIVVSRNGVNFDRFDSVEVEKDPLKIVWPSSPDRGLDRVIDIVEIARQKSGLDFSLHIYYGFDNMKKYGGAFANMAAHLEEKIKRPWITYHGNVEQRVLAKELKSASYWLYPATFIESYCITVLEAVCAGVWSMVREIGALKNTVKPFSDQGMADLLFLDAGTDEEKAKWADYLIEAHNEKKYKLVKMKGDYSWEGVAKHFMEFMNIKPELVAVNEKSIDLSTVEKGYESVDIGV